MINSEIEELDKAGLRKFGFTTGIIVCLLFGLLLPWLFGFNLPLWPWILALVLWLWAAIHPATLRPVYRGWMRVGLVLGFINTRIILFILFYLIFLPVGLVMKLFNNDPMARKLQQDQGSYRVISRQRDNKHFERPY